MEVKICGVCRPEDAAAAAVAGAAYVGVIFAPGGPRSRTVEQARPILDAAAGVRRVGVFVNAPAEEVSRVAEALGLDVVQLHGAEPPEVVASLRNAGFEVWKAVRPRDQAEFLAGLDAYGDVADALHLDGWNPRAPGGTGTSFPWREVAEVRPRVRPPLRLVVAGGLTPATVGSAVRLLRPDVVDVSSGVESAPGVKDTALVAAFIAAARQAAREAGVDSAGAVADVPIT